jgi:hypothetical protein
MPPEGLRPLPLRPPVLVGRSQPRRAAFDIFAVVGCGRADGECATPQPMGHVPPVRPSVALHQCHPARKSPECATGQSQLRCAAHPKTPKVERTPMCRLWTKAIPLAITLVLGTIVVSARSEAADANCQPGMMAHSSQHHAAHHASMMRHHRQMDAGMMAKHRRHMRMIMRHGAMHGGNRHSAMMGMHGKANIGIRGATKARPLAAKPAKRVAARSTHTGH